NPCLAPQLNRLRHDRGTSRLRRRLCCLQAARRRKVGRHYDVIIVGGRVAGSSLAMRLDQQGLKVLMIDRATFPSWPSVPSSPAAHLGTLELLDELGLDEKEYTYPGGKASHMVMDVAGQYQVKLPFSRLGKSRDYVYGI